MQRVKRSTAVATLPAPPVGGTPGFFTGGSPGLGPAPTVPGYDWYNGVQEELIGLILRGGLTASDADLAQVRKSLDRLFGGGLASLSANTTLTVDDAGLVLVNASAGARTITLPAANALGGRPVRFQAGTDTIEGGTSVVLSGQWASVTLVSDGAGSWVALRGRFATAAETDAGTLTDAPVTPASLGIAARNYANPGYARLPGGLILQWGVTNSVDVANVGSLSSVTATFPIAFPNAVFNIQGTPRNTGVAFTFALHDAVATLTGCTFQMSEWAGGAQNVSVNYLAIGR